MICSRPDLYAGRGGNTLYFRSDANHYYQRLVKSKLSFHVYRPTKLKTFEAVAWPPSIARKPRTDTRFIANPLLFFRRQKSKISFVRRTAFILALEHSSETKFINFPQRYLDKSDKSPIRCSSPAVFTFYDSMAIELLPCFSVFTIQIKRCFNRNFWSPCT